MYCQAAIIEAFQFQEVTYTITQSQSSLSIRIIYFNSSEKY